MIMDRTILINILKEEDYPVHMIERTASKLENLQPIVAAALENWISKGDFPLLTVDDYSFSSLVSDYGMKPIGALLTLDWLIRDPERAKQSLKRGIR